MHSLSLSPASQIKGIEAPINQKAPPFHPLQRLHHATNYLRQFISDFSLILEPTKGVIAVFIQADGKVRHTSESRIIREGIQDHWFLQYQSGCAFQSSILVGEPADPSKALFNYRNHLRINDEAFSIRARCQSLPLYGLRTPNNSYSERGICRVAGCGYSETLGHVLGFCAANRVLVINRHNYLLDRLFTRLPTVEQEKFKEVHFEGSRLRPDLLVLQRKKGLAFIVDLTCRLPSSSVSLDSHRGEKQEKYHSLAQHPRLNGYKVVIDAVVLSPLGGWLPSNNGLLQKLGLTRRFIRLTSLHMRSDAIRYSNYIYECHLRQDRQLPEPQMSVQEPFLPFNTPGGDPQESDSEFDP